jgi:hypothetical protein
MANCKVCGAFSVWIKKGAECNKCFSDQFTTYTDEFKIIPSQVLAPQDPDFSKQGKW